MSPAWITGMAAVTALGESLEALWPRLLAGETAIGPVTRFDTSRLDFHAAACVRDLEKGEHPNLTCALMARCLDQLGPVPRETFVIWAGVKGDAEWVEGQLTCNAECGMRNAEWGIQNSESRIQHEIPPAGGTPEHTAHASSIPHSVFRIPQSYRRWICERLGLCGAGLELNAACASSAAGLALGAMMLERGQAGAVLVCAADLVTRFTFMGFAALRGLTPGICRPLDAARDGLALGDGAAAMLLMNDEELSRSGARPLARLSGWGLANDATHITAPARDGCGLIAAIHASCGMRNAECGKRNEEGIQNSEYRIQNGIPPEGVIPELHSAIRNPQSAIIPGAWCLHGTGTVYNDAMELTALEAVFGERRFPIFSIKGAVGHTLGAAGALEAAVCVKVLQEGLIPPTAGLVTPEPRAEGRAAAAAQPFDGRSILTTNSGFGGVNAALMIEK